MMFDKIKRRISQLKIDKKEIIVMYMQTECESERDVLADKNFRLDTEINFLNELLSYESKYEHGT